jgi:hypothetical protein
VISEPMIISQSPEEIRAAQTLQSKCELLRVALRECHASAAQTDEAMIPPFSLQLSHTSSAGTITNKSLKIEVSFEIRGIDSGSPPSQVFGVTCVFDLYYQISDSAFQPTAESVAAFKDGNAVFNCWPYVREFTQSITSRMEVTPPPLPLLRLVPKTSQPVETTHGKRGHVSPATEVAAQKT